MQVPVEKDAYNLKAQMVLVKFFHAFGPRDTLWDQH